MSSPMIPCPIQYNDIPGGGVQAVIVVASSAPTTQQNQQAPGTFWLVPEPAGNGDLYYLAGFISGVPKWELVSVPAGAVASVSGTPNQITSSTVAGAVTLSIPSAFTAPGSVTAASGNITATNGNLVLGTAGNKLAIATGANSSTGVTAAMTAGAITITSTAITTSSVILYSRDVLGGAAGEISITAQSAGSATLTSSSGSETSTFNYLIIN